MGKVRTCCQCGAPLGNDAPEGFCPVCMLEGALQAGEKTVHSIEAEPGSSLPRLGDYQLIEEIARGGMGVVYRARQVSLDRVVAVKLILVGQFADKAGIKRFKGEAAAAAKLRHPNIVAIHEIGEQSGQHFFSMEYVEGQNLADFMRQQPISIRQAAQFVKKIAEAVDYAHEQGIVHRDLKPSNILIDGLFEPRITDFGLARDLKSDADLTLTGQVLGSPNYISPEQASGNSATGIPSDIYSLGAILYHILTARPPFAAETLTATLHQVTTADPVSPRILNPSVPRDLETICLKCLEKEPSRRYPSAHTLADEVNRFLNDEPIHARPISAPAKAWRWCRRKPVVAGLAAAFTISLLLGFTGVVWQWLRAERHLYTTDMIAAQNALRDENIGYAKEILGRYRPKWWKRDLRNWEWYYASNQSQSDELFSVRAFEFPVLSIAAARSGTVLAVGGSGPVILWDINRKEELAKLWCSNEVAVYALAFSSDDKRLFTGTSDGRVLIWNVQTRQRDLVLTNGSSVRSLKISRDQNLLAVYAHGGLTLWSLTNYEQVAAFPQTGGTDNLPGGMAFSPDSSLLAYGLEGGDIVLLNLASTNEVATFKGHESNVTGLAFSQDGTTLISCSRDGTVSVREVLSGRNLKQLNVFSAFLSDLALSPNGKLLSVVGAGQHVRVFETESWQQINTLKGHEAHLRAVTFSADGKQIISGARDGTVKFWPVVAKQPSSLRLRELTWAELLEGAKGLYVIHTNETHAWWNTESFAQTTIKFARTDDPIIISPDGKHLATATKDGVKIFNSTTEGPATQIPLRYSGGRNLAFSGDGRLLAVTGFEHTCQVWRITPKDVGGYITSRVASLDLGDSDGHRGLLKFSSSAKMLSLIPSKTGVPAVWKIASREEIRLNTNWTQSDIAISRDGKIALTACGSGKLRIWDLRSGHQITALGGQLGSLLSVEFSPDDTRMVACGGDGTVRVWDRETLQEVAVLKLQNDRLYQLAFSATGETLFVLGGDYGALRLFTLRAPKVKSTSY